MVALKYRQVTLGTRPSKLARWQTDHIAGLIQQAWPGTECRVVTFVTEGDKTLDRPLPEIGGKGVFTADLEAALQSGEIDLAVHSLKDLPIEGTPGLKIGAVSRRLDGRDVLVTPAGGHLDDLPQGARLGTSSLRRSAQLLARRPDLVLLPLRGNVDTRIRKALQGEYDAIVLAAAGVLRLGLEANVAEYLPFDVMLPAPGQGALAIQCRQDDTLLHRLLTPIHDPSTWAAVTAERTFLAALGGGCSAPVAAYAEPSGSTFWLRGLVASADGRKVIRVSGADENPARLGKTLAGQALAQGAAELLR